MRRATCLTASLASLSPRRSASPRARVTTPSPLLRPSQHEKPPRAPAGRTARQGGPLPARGTLCHLCDGRGRDRGDRRHVRDGLPVCDALQILALRRDVAPGPSLPLAALVRAPAVTPRRAAWPPCALCLPLCPPLASAESSEIAACLWRCQRIGGRWREPMSREELSRCSSFAAPGSGEPTVSFAPRRSPRA